MAEMDNWKRILLKAAGVGGGFALVAAVILGIVVSWSGRPVKPKPWDDKAIVASYESLDTEGETNTFRFNYTLENKTDIDYRVETDSRVHLAAFLKQSQALSFSNSENLHADYPIYIPAKSRVRFQIHLGYPYPIKPDYNASNDVRHDFYTKEAQYVTNELGNVDGFILLDDDHRYKIVMPNGWTERAKQPMRATSPAQ